MRNGSPLSLLFKIMLTMNILTTRCKSITEIPTTEVTELWLMIQMKGNTSINGSDINSTTTTSAMVTESPKKITLKIGKKTTKPSLVAKPTYKTVAMTTKITAVDNQFSIGEFTYNISLSTDILPAIQTSKQIIIRKTTKTVINKDDDSKVSPAMKAGVIAGVSGGVAIIIVVCATWKFCCVKFFDNKQKVVPADFRNNENDGEEKVASSRRESWKEY